MSPWEILDRLGQQDPEAVLNSLKPDDPFWIGASYGIDPFVGMVVRRPMGDPHSYGSGVSADLFDKIVKAILDGQLHGDQLAIVLERFSRSCREPEWLCWYGPILRGQLMLPFGLDLYNRYAGTRLQPPALNKPKAVDLAHLPKRFIVQPAYDGVTFWFINSKDDPIEVRGYDATIRRIRDQPTEIALAKLGHKQAMDVVVMGFLTADGFFAEDLLTREQFTRESVVEPLHRRAVVMAKLGFPLVQMSDLLTQIDEEFMKEISLIFEQGYKGAVIRDLDAGYPFRKQSDCKVTLSRFNKLQKTSS